MDGSSLREIGQKIALGEMTVKDVIHVFPSTPGRLLVSWKTAEELKTLPEDYPQQIQSIRKVASKEDISEEDLVNELPTVFDGQWMAKNFVLS